MLAAPPVQGFELPDISTVWCMSGTCGRTWCIFLFSWLSVLSERGVGCSRDTENAKYFLPDPWKRLALQVRGKGDFEAAYIPSAPTGCLDKERSSFSIMKQDDCKIYMNTEVLVSSFWSNSGGGCGHLCAHACVLLALHGRCWIKVWSWNLCLSTNPTAYSLGCCWY